MKKHMIVLSALMLFMLSTGATQASSDIKFFTSDLGYGHIAEIKSDNTLWMHGDNSHGQLGTGDTIDREEPVLIMSGVKSVAIGWYSTLVLKTDGTMWGFGYNLSGQLGIKGKYDSKNNFNIIEPKQIMTGIKAISAGKSYGLALKYDGSLYSFGSNSNYKLGFIHKPDSTGKVPSFEPTLILTDVASISAGEQHAAAVTKDGSLYTWGLNSPDNRCGFPITGAFIQTPKKLMDGVLTVDCGSGTTAIITTNGTLYMCGDNMEGQLGIGTRDYINKPITRKIAPVPVLAGVVSVSAFEEYTVAIKADGSKWKFGTDSREGFSSNSPTKVAN